MSLPSFFIIGAPGAGTTALHAALATHPDLFLPQIKEPRFFLSNGSPPPREWGPGDHAQSSEWTWTFPEYEALFAPAPAHAQRGEATPYYLYDRAAQERIRNAVPNARLIAILRNPVDRAYSNWNRQWTDTYETREFGDAIAAEEQRAVKGWGRAWRYLGLGRYGEQLEHLFSVFPREQVHVVRYRDMVEDPESTLRSVCDFLDVDNDIVRRIPPVRVSIFGGPRRPARQPRLGRARPLPPEPEGERPQLATEDRRALVEYFADDIRHVEELLGRSFWDWFSEEGTGTYRTRSRRSALARRDR